MSSQLPDIISLHELLKVSLALGHLDESVLQKFLGSWSLQVCKIPQKAEHISLLQCECNKREPSLYGITKARRGGSGHSNLRL